MSNSSSSDDIVNICHLFENTHLSESQNTSTNPSHSISSITGIITTTVAAAVAAATTI